MTFDAEAMPDARIDAITVVRTSPENFSTHGRFLSMCRPGVSWLTLDRKFVTDFRMDIHIVVIPLDRTEAPTSVQASELGTIGFMFLVYPPIIVHKETSGGPICR